MEGFNSGYLLGLLYEAREAFEQHRYGPYPGWVRGGASSVHAKARGITRRPQEIRPRGVSMKRATTVLSLCISLGRPFSKYYLFRRQRLLQPPRLVSLWH